MTVNDWTPVIAALATFISTLSAAVTALVVVYQHRGTRDRIASNSKQLDMIQQQTNGTLTDLQSAVRSLRAEVVHQAEVVAVLQSAVRGGGLHAPPP